MRVAFIGKMRAGKDTCCDYYTAKFEGINLKFAAPLYEIQSAVYKIAGLEEKKDRLLLQWLGTEWGRSIDENIWVNVLARKIDALPEKTNIFISDCRFENEERMLREKGFVFIKIEAADEKLQERGASLVTHSSEHFASSYQGADYIIKNDSTLAKLYEKLDALAYLL